ncbi:MAG: hypothetical protein AAGI91_10680 [Bacteroidota bacterium]
MSTSQQYKPTLRGQADLNGMTLNERLYVTGLRSEFDQARKRRDRLRIVALLEQVEVHGADAQWTANEILKPWWKAVFDLLRGRYSHH